MTDFLAIKADIEKIQSAYVAQSQQKTFKALVYGGFGSGKTQLIRTARRPILVDSFDPGGTKTNRDQISEGWIVADTQFEQEDPKAPSVAELWDRVYHERRRRGFFNYFGTYVLDSATTLSTAIMNLVLKKAGRVGSHPFQQDYLPAMQILENAVRDMSTLPCDVILIAHEDVDKDETTGRMYVGPQFVGKLKQRLPLLFDEIYHAETEFKASGVEYRLLTRATGTTRARTRLGRDGKFETYEKPDIKALLHKAGYSTEDKPII